MLGRALLSITVGLLFLATIPGHAQTTSAANVSPAVFGANTLNPNGTYTFPSGLRIGVTSPFLTGDSLVVGVGFSVQRFGGGTEAANATLTGARGTEAAPAASGLNDETGRLMFRGTDASPTPMPMSSARITGVVDGSVGAGSVPQAVTVRTGTTSTNTVERMRITSGGTVAIGTTAPDSTAAVHVVGKLKVDGEIRGTKVIGAVYQDLAEWVPATQDLAPGTVVVLNGSKVNEVMASQRAYDTSVAGVVSAQPGIILGVEGDGKEQIATTGRVKVRVDARTAPIRVGDLLVTSDVPGTAMRSEPMEINGRRFHQPGTLIGKALEPIEGRVGEILVLLSMQ